MGGICINKYVWKDRKTGRENRTGKQDGNRENRDNNAHSLSFFCAKIDFLAGGATATGADTGATTALVGAVTGAVTGDAMEAVTGDAMGAATGAAMRSAIGASGADSMSHQ